MSDEQSQQHTDDSSEQTTEVQTQSEEMVSKAELQKVLDDMHKYKKAAKEYEAQFKEREMSELKKREEWQKVAELKEKEAQEAVAEANKLKESFLNTQKYNAIKEKALADGIRKEALADLELIDFDDDVAIETTNTGKINVIGADSAVKKLKALRPHWFGKSMGNVNTDSPDVVVGGEITMDKLLEAQQKATRSGDYKEYEKLLKAYRQQG